MSSDPPNIKFSPFEALLIGEKNKIIRKEPPKNTLYIKKLNQQKKTFSLRDLFDLKEDSSESKNSDSVFKVPQRVRDFLKNHKKLKRGRIKKTNNKMEKDDNKKKNKDILCYEFENHKLIVKGDEYVEFKVNDKNQADSKPETKKEVRFKPQFRFTETLEEKIVNKIHNNRRLERARARLHRNVMLTAKVKSRPKRQYFRGKDGKFCKRTWPQGAKKTTARSKYLSNYLHNLYLKKNKNACNNNTSTNPKDSESDHDSDCNYDDPEYITPPSYAIEDVIGLPKSNETINLNLTESKLDEISMKYYEIFSNEEVSFPPYPDYLQKSDFENDLHLSEIIYEKQPKFLNGMSKEHPKVVLEETDYYVDFEEALKEENVVFPVKSVKRYDRKKAKMFKKYERKNNNRYSCNKYGKFCMNIKNGYIAGIDEPLNMDNQLIEGTNLGTLFLNGFNDEIFLSNLVKPVLHDCPFGALPDI